MGGGGREEGLEMRSKTEAAPEDEPNLPMVLKGGGGRGSLSVNLAPSGKG